MFVQQHLEKAWLMKVGAETPTKEIEEQQRLLIKTTTNNITILKAKNRTLTELLLHKNNYQFYLELIRSQIEGTYRIITNNNIKFNPPPTEPGVYICEFTIYFPDFSESNEEPPISTIFENTSTSILPGIKGSIPIIWRKPQPKDLLEWS
jgi:hypothetical protein